jgi:fructoselysine-6-phosphate deglycase
MFNEGYFPEYADFADNLKNLGRALAKVRIACDEKCKKYAADYGYEPYNIWIGSGDLWPTAYSYSMCVLEESLWIRTKSVTSAEFFHGTLELVDKDVCVTLILGEGVTRSQDERVKEFVKDLSDKFTCFDTKDYELESIKDEYRKYLSPIVMAAILQRIGKNAEVLMDHSLDIRRYYRKSNY